MKTTKLLMGLGAIVFCGMAGYLGIQHRQKAALEAELQQLHTQLQEMDGLAAENERLTRLIAQGGSGLSTDEMNELLRLRSEVTQLREQATGTVKRGPFDIAASVDTATGQPKPGPAYEMPLRESSSPEMSYTYELARMGNLEEMKKFLDQHPEFIKEPVGIVGATLLHTAAYNNRLEVARELIRRSADVNAQTKEGNTPLYDAAGKGNKELVLLLLENGADFRIRNNAGMNALQFAIQKNRQDIVDLLTQLGARP